MILMARLSLFGKTRIAASRLLIFCLLPFLFASCSADRASVVSADATAGYCVVCKMKVNASDPWTSEIHFSDGKKLMFETPGDMAAFYVEPEKYKVPESQKDRAGITKIVVKDYQTRQPLDGREAILVYKSKIESDMGPDLVPLTTREAAEKFVAANSGTIVALGEVTPEMVHNLRKK
jgi:nitrous oxide reductase accessory protein NosL